MTKNSNVISGLGFLFPTAAGSICSLALLLGSCTSVPWPPPGYDGATTAKIRSVRLNLRVSSITQFGGLRLRVDGATSPRGCTLYGVMDVDGSILDFDPMVVSPNERRGMVLSPGVPPGCSRVRVWAKNRKGQEIGDSEWCSI